jgi:hypothetical protein
MSHNDQEPVATAGDDGRTTYTHPAYGQIVMTRVSGRSVLYGSDFVHEAAIRITIGHSSLVRKPGSERYFPEDTIATFEMSEAQWASFVSSAGLGAGTPITLRRLGNAGVPSIPYRNEADAYMAEAQNAANESVEALYALRAKIEAGVTGLSKSRANEMLTAVEDAINKITSHLPFIMEQYAEYMEKMREKAKAEIHAHIHSTIRAAGLEALTGGAAPFRLPGPSEK